MRKGIGILGIIVSMLFAGCSGDATGPDPQVALSFEPDAIEIVRDSIHVEWMSEDVLPVWAYDPPVPRASVVENRVVLRGVVVFPTSGMLPFAELLRTGDILEMRVFVKRQGLFDEPSAWAYRAEVVGLPPGDYTLRLRHEDVHPLTDEGIVLDRDVTIPSGG